MQKGMKFALVAVMAALIVAGCNSNKDDGNNGSPSPGTSIAPSDNVNGNGADGTGQEDEEGKGEEDLSPKDDDNDQLGHKTIKMFYADKELMGMYYVEKEVSFANEEDAPKAALEAWMKGADVDQLTNIVPPEVVVESFEAIDGVAYVSFSSELKNANLGSSGELFLMDQIALIMKQFGYSATQVLIEGEIEESLLGHVSTDRPHEAPDEGQYEAFKP